MVMMAREGWPLKYAPYSLDWGLWPCIRQM